MYVDYGRLCRLYSGMVEISARIMVMMLPRDTDVESSVDEHELCDFVRSPASVRMAQSS